MDLSGFRPNSKLIPTPFTCGSVLQVSEVWRSADRELELLRGAVGIRGLQLSVGDEDAVTPAAQIHHGAGTPPGGESGGCPVNAIHLSTAGS